MKVFAALQQPYIRLINLLVPYVKKINEKLRDIFLELSVSMILLLSLYDVVFTAFPLPMSGTLKPLLMCFFFFDAVIFSIRDKVEPVKLNHAPVAFFVLDILALIISFFVKLDSPGSDGRAEFFSWITIYAILLPMLFIVWTNRRDPNALYRRLTRSYSCILTVYCAAMVFVGHWGYVSHELRLTGTTDHPNTLAAVIFTCLVCCVYNLLTEELGVLSVIYWAGVGLSGFLLMLTGSRTTLAAAAGALLVLFVYTLMKKNRGAAVTLLAVCALFAVSFCAARPYYTHEIKEVFAGSVVVSGSSVSATDPAEYIDRQVEEKLDSFEERREHRLSLEGKTLNGILNNRPRIWKNYLQRLNFFGKDSALRRAQAAENNEIMAKGPHAHNLFIEMAFRYGVIAGCASLLIAAAAVVWIGFRLFDRSPFEKYRVFSILALCEFCITAIPEFYGKPLYSPVSLLYIFALLPIFCKQPAEAEEPLSGAEKKE